MTFWCNMWIFSSALMVLFFNACGSEKNLETKDDNTAKEYATNKVNNNNFEIRGRLEFKGFNHEKNWEGYNGLEFFIVDDKDGLRFPVMESDTISRDELMKFVGNNVKLEVIPYQPENCPDIASCGAFIMDEDGKQLRRTIRFKIQKVSVIKK
jgi:hypothetical protein